MWPLLTSLALAGIVLLHLWWRRRFRAAQMAAQYQLNSLQQSQRQTAVQMQTQQQALFNSMVEGLLLLDETGHIQLANRAFAELFGVTGDIRSRTLMEVLRLHELADLVATLETSKQVLGYELKLATPNERLLQVNASAICSNDGRSQGSILVFHDLTRLKQLERTRQEFVANVSHELRTPLSLIKGYVETLLDGAKDNPEVADRFLLTIQRNAERLQLLIEDLLTISQLESGRIKLNLQPVALRTVGEKVMGDLQSRAAARKVKLVEELPELQVRADPDRLEQVLGNLVDNAIKYGRTEGTVRLSARKTDPGWVEVSVQDDGPGIPPEALERVFERFYRVDKARSREQGGTGLGLSIVKHIIQNHGGKVWARSTPGAGACFFFTLPQPTDEVPEPARQPTR